VKPPFILLFRGARILEVVNRDQTEYNDTEAFFGV